MKHVCNCRACDSAPELESRQAQQSNPHEKYGHMVSVMKRTGPVQHRYVCKCGIRGPVSFRTSRARGMWNEENAEAQNTKRLTVAMQELVAQLKPNVVAPSAEIFRNGPA